jgi:periplasmic divalent cation tolerance protein
MKNDQKTLIQVTTTVNDEHRSREIAKELIEARLVACVQVFSVYSHYTWNGEYCSEKEYLLQMKTLECNFETIDRWMEKNHPYETPELIATPISKVSEGYLSWVNAQCSS